MFFQPEQKHEQKQPPAPSADGAQIAFLLEQAEAEQANHDQINGDNKIEQPRHDQDQDSGDQSHDRLQVGHSDGHERSPRFVMIVTAKTAFRFRHAVKP
jgi:hypothetical protein